VTGRKRLASDRKRSADGRKRSAGGRKHPATGRKKIPAVQRFPRLLCQTSEVSKDLGGLCVNGIIVFMPRRLIPFISEGYYHIYNRGNNRGAIFFEQENYLYFLQGLKKYLLPAADIIAYCLMPTHYHLMVRVKQQTSEVPKTSEISVKQTSEVSETSEVSRAMQKLLISYTKAINKRFERVGALFQGAFQSRPVTDSKYLLQLCRYIHANPVKDGLVTDPLDWPYSNYLDWIDERDGALIDRDFIRTQFPNPIDYKDFVLDYVRTRKMPEDVLEYLNALEA